ncbi:unnamed protein product [Blumeria hordei]|uniref:Uncharacterized protein n=1 Tax=Blumeria hordei TaxID=2867405 RepID=A0A383UP00_BLUHO|nr:unnamed protein product [Blumeria hordei]
MLARLNILFNTATAPFIHDLPVLSLFSQLNPRDLTGIKPIIHENLIVLLCKSPYNLCNSAELC